MICPSDDDTMAHELGELTVNRSREQEAHMAACPRCRERRAQLRELLADLAAPRSVASRPVASRQLASRQDDERGQHADGERFVARVMGAIGSGRASPARSPMRMSWFTLAAAAAVVTVPLALTLRSDDVPVGTFTARGGPAASATVSAEVLVVRNDRLAPVANERLGAQDSLAVRVTNTTESTQHLMVFGRDAAGELHWIYPAYTSAAEDPSSVAVPPGTRAQLLAEVVEPDQPVSGRFVVMTVFSRTPLRVKAVEQRLAGQTDAATRTSVGKLFPDARVEVVSAVWGGP